MLENVLRDLLKFRLIDILDNIQDGADYILDIINCINGIDCSLEDLEYYENDNDFFNTYYYNNPFEVARACSYGDYHVVDDYVRINVYGNLESISYYELITELKKSMNEIIDRIIDLKDELFKYNNELMNIYNEYKKIEEVYNVLNNEIYKGFESNIEWVLDDFYNILVHVNDGFSLDIDIEANGNCIPTYKFILSLNYEEDDIEVIYIFDFEEDSKGNIKFINIENIKINEV